MRPGFYAWLKDLPALAAEVPSRAAAWCRRVLLPRCLGFLLELWQAIWSHRVRSILVTLACAACLLAAIQIVPAVYGRFALAHAAGLAARQIQLKGQEQVLFDLRRQAFDLGLVEAALEPDTFHLDFETSEEGPTCTVSYAFTHEVKFYGVARLPMRIQAKVTRAVVAPPPPARAGEGDQ